MRKPRKSNKPKITNKATLDAKKQESEQMAERSTITSSNENTMALGADNASENTENNANSATVQAEWDKAVQAASTAAADNVAAQVAAAQKPEDTPTRRKKPKLVIAHCCPDERCNFKTTSDEKTCPYDGNKLIYDKYLNRKSNQ